MSSVSLSLDTLRLRDQSSQLRLYATATLHFDGSPTTSAASGEQSLLDTILSRKCWIARGSFCHIDVAVLFNGSPIPSARSSGFLDCLGQHICSAPVWAQLGLSVSMNDAAFNDAIDSKICIPLSYDRFSEGSHSSSSVSFCSIADVRPPDRTPVIGLDRLYIVMDFHVPFLCPRGTGTPIPERSRHLDSDNPLGDHFDTVKNNVFEHLPLDGIFSSKTASAELWQLDHSSRIQNIPVLDSNEFRSEFEELLDNNSVDELLLPTTTENASLPVRDSPQSTQQTQSYFLRSSQNQSFTSCASNITTPRSEPVAKVDDPELPFMYQESACRTAELAFRILIGGKQKKKTAGMKCTKPPPTYSLSELAPALFNPGFLKALAERSHLISPLKQTFSKSLLMHAQSPILRRNIQQLSTLVSDSEQVSNRFCRTQESDQLEKKFSRAIGDRLWHLAQHQLYNYEAPQQLKRPRHERPSKHERVEAAFDSDDNDEILDLEDSQCYDGRETMYENSDGFVDLLRSDRDYLESEHLNLFLDEDNNSGLEGVFASVDENSCKYLETCYIDLVDQVSVSDGPYELFVEEARPDDMVLDFSFGEDGFVEVTGQLLDHGDAIEHMQF